MSINLDKKYEKYLSKYNQLFTQMNGGIGGIGSFFSTTKHEKPPEKTPEPISNHENTPEDKLRLLKEKLVTGNIYRMIHNDDDDDDYFYLHVVDDTVYLIKATIEGPDEQWKTAKYTVEQARINGYNIEIKNERGYPEKAISYYITKEELIKALGKKEWCGIYLCLDYIFKPEQGQVRIKEVEI
jgi:hypothetical protein